MGSVCATCLGATARRSTRLARWVALASTLALAAYVALRLLPVVPPAMQGAARALAAGAAVVWCWLTYRIAKEVALAWLG